MLSNNFYTLIGAVEAALAFLQRNSGQKATGDPHLDPNPGMVDTALTRLRQFKDDLLAAEGLLANELYAARQSDDKNRHDAAWGSFNAELTRQSFILATIIRRLINAGAQGSPTGAREWDSMETRLRRILKAYAAVGLGGGDGEDPANDLTGITGSSDEPIST